MTTPLQSPLLHDSHTTTSTTTTTTTAKTIEPYKYKPFFDGHELSVLSTLVGSFVLFDRTLPNGWMKHFVHRHPGPALAVSGGLFGIVSMVISHRVRLALGLSTDNYDPSAPGAYKQKWRKEVDI